MIFRLVLGAVFFLSSILSIHAGTVTFLHKNSIEIKLKDAVYPNALDYAPKLKFRSSTVFQLPESDFHFFLVSYKSKEYYLWIDDLSTDIEIDVLNPEINSSKATLISKENWLSGKLDVNNSALEKLNEVDLYYVKALDSLNNIAQTDAQFRAENNYNSIVWDSRSAKRLYNLAIDKFNYQFDDKWIHSAPAFTQYWQFMYKLYYQYFDTNSFKGLNKLEIKSKIEADFEYPESKVLVFHHFFRDALPLKELEENFQVLNNYLSLNEAKLAEALIQKQAVENILNAQKIDFLFGIDIDRAMEGYFARDSSKKKNVLVFWSTWDSDMDSEFNLLTDLKVSFKEKYNFIHICIDAYERPDKTKSFIYQNRVGGFHLLPEQSNAFRKSSFRKDLKIRDFPFYVLTDHNGKIIETESMPLVISHRLENKLEYFSTKK